MGDDAASGWTIKSWDRERARGVIASRQIGDVAFDGAAALVDDFRVGERVEVELERRGDSFRVKRIWPDDPRFAPRGDLPAIAPALAPSLASRLAGVLARVPADLGFRVVRLEDDLVVQGDDDGFAFGCLVEIRFRDVEYVELPMGWDGKAFGLANDMERRYLASRSELLAMTAAIRIVDTDRHIFFVTCADVEATLRSS
jgi:hypothetical protein